MKTLGVYTTILAVLVSFQVQAQSFDDQGYYQENEAAPRARPQKVRRVAHQIQDEQQYDGQMDLDETAQTLSQPRRRVAPAKGSLIRLEPVLGATQSSYEGLNSKKIKGQVFDSKGQTGYLGGVGALIGRGRLQGESGLFVAERSVTVSMKDDSPIVVRSEEHKYKTRYIEVPMLARWSFAPPTKSNFFIKGGIIGAWLQEATDEETVSVYGSSSSRTTNAKNIFKDVDYRLAAGAGGQLRMNKDMSLLVQGDYQYGLQKSNQGGIADFYLNSFSVSAGVSFDL